MLKKFFKQESSMPSHRRMRSYFLKLAHTFSTPISSLSNHARSKHKHDHDFLFTISSETKINDKLLPLPWLSLSTTPSSTFFFSFLFLLFLSSLRSTYKTVNEKFCHMEIQVSTRGGWVRVTSCLYFMLEGNRFRSSVFTYIKR